MTLGAYLYIRAASVAIEAVLKDIDLVFETEPGIFSPKAIDRGTSLLLSLVQFKHTDKVLDLGCGYGVMGIYAAKRLSPSQVYMIDNDPKAIRLAVANAALNGVPGVHITLSDGFQVLRETGFTKILCNPPYHTDFSVAKHFIEKGFNRLTIGGEIWMVTMRERWYRNKLANVFGSVRVVSEGPYFVFQTMKKQNTYAHRTSG
jgi:16S rRNA (guanine1207-N2)-methyltransferase